MRPHARYGLLKSRSAGCGPSPPNRENIITISTHTHTRRIVIMETIYTCTRVRVCHAYRLPGRRFHRTFSKNTEYILYSSVCTSTQYYYNIMYRYAIRSPYAPRDTVFYPDNDILFLLFLCTSQLATTSSRSAARRFTLYRRLRR